MLTPEPLLLDCPTTQCPALLWLCSQALRLPAAQSVLHGQEGTDSSLPVSTVVALPWPLNLRLTDIPTSNRFFLQSILDYLVSYWGPQK
jgi:hypothetical protein